MRSIFWLAWKTEEKQSESGMVEIVQSIVPLSVIRTGNGRTERLDFRLRGNKKSFRKRKKKIQKGRKIRRGKFPTRLISKLTYSVFFIIRTA